MMTWQRRINFAAWSAWLTAAVFMAVSALLLFGQDFRDFYAAARVLLAGGDVYDYRQVAAMMQAVAGYARYNPFYYPPWFAVAMAPFALLPYGAARVAWMACNVLAWIGGLFALSKAMEWPSTPTRAEGGLWGGGGRWLLYLMATYLFAWVTWRYEQLGIWMFALLAGALWALRARRDALSGVLLALMLTKPTVNAVLVGALLVWLWRGKRRRAVGAFGAALAVLLVVSLPLLPAYLRHLRDPDFGRGLAYVLNASGGIEKLRINSTLKDWLASFHIGAPWPTLLYALSAVTGLGVLALVAWRASSPVTVASVAAVIGFWLAPYALQYDFPPLTVTLFFVLRALGPQTVRVRVVGTGLLLGVLSVPFWERPISDGFWIVVGLAALLGWLTLTRGDGTQRMADGRQDLAPR